MKELLGWSLDGALDPWSCLSYTLQILHGSSYELPAGIRAKRKNLKLGKIKEIDITRSFFELHTPDFAWKFV